jgi:hypothetical protein
MRRREPDQYRPNRVDYEYGPAFFARAKAAEYLATLATMEGTAEGWSESDCTGDDADGLGWLVCPDYHQHVNGGAVVSGEVGSGCRRWHVRPVDVRPVDAHPASAFAEVLRD